MYESSDLSQGERMKRRGIWDEEKIETVNLSSFGNFAFPNSSTRGRQLRLKIQQTESCFCRFEQEKPYNILNYPNYLSRRRILFDHKDNF